MRNWKFAGLMASLGFAVALAWTAWASAGPNTVPPVAGSPRAVDRDGSAAGMLAFSTTLVEDRQQITIIDPVSRVMSVYHIEPKSGEIVLRAVRNVTWDMEMTVFNGTSPLPQEIRSQLQHR
jgi:hypothetical protein